MSGRLIPLLGFGHVSLSHLLGPCFGVAYGWCPLVGYVVDSGIVFLPFALIIGCQVVPHTLYCIMVAEVLGGVILYYTPPCFLVWGVPSYQA